MKALRIGTRGSALALWQARAVAAALERAGASSELVIITTRGDARQDAPLSAIGGKGVFVTEIHDAMRRREIDIAVHSAKDMAAVVPEGLSIAAVLPREDPRDAIVLPGGRALSTELTCIGTGSPRRVAQLRRLYPAARFDPIRGNVDSRLRKLDAGDVQALVLACAGLRRLGLESRISMPLPIDDCVPAPGQGIIAVEVRSSDTETARVVAALNDRRARTALFAEQAVVAALGGGCQLPLGVFAEMDGHELAVRAVASSADGSRLVQGQARGDASRATDIGTRLAADLASRGALELLHS